MNVRDDRDTCLLLPSLVHVPYDSISWIDTEPGILNATGIS